MMRHTGGSFRRKESSFPGSGDEKAQASFPACLRYHSKILPKT